MTVEGPEGPRGEVVITKPFARLGRDRRSEVELADAGVLPCHAYLHATNEGVYYAGFGPGSQNGWLLPSSTLELGPFRVRAVLNGVRPLPVGSPDLPRPVDPQSKGSAGPSVPRIRMFTDKSRASHADLLLLRQLTLIGRQSPATWRIKHPTISRAHGALVWDGCELWLIDFFSSNGTRLGENRCDASLVAIGQEFRIGTVTCCFLDVQPAAAAAALGEPAAGASDWSDSSTRGPPAGGKLHSDDSTRERRVDAPQGHDEMLAPPHAPAADSGRRVRVPPRDSAPVPLGERPSPEAGPAALVETRPLTGDTKFVDRPQRSLEDRLAAAEMELAAQRDTAAARATRMDSELLALSRDVQRLEAAQRQERESASEHRAQVAELRERVLRELSQIGEQTQILRQACDARPWEGSLARLADDTVRRCTALESQLREGLQAAADKLAGVEGSMIAKMAELRSRQDGLGGQGLVSTTDDAESVLSVELPTDEWPSSEDLQVPQVLSAPGGKRVPAEQTEGSQQPPPGVRPARDGSRRWRLGEEFTERLVDFQVQRERSAWQRRFMWTGAAVTFAVVVVLSAGLLRSWLDKDRTFESEAPSSRQEQPSHPAEQTAE